MSQFVLCGKQEPIKMLAASSGDQLGVLGGIYPGFCNFPPPILKDLPPDTGVRLVEINGLTPTGRKILEFILFFRNVSWQIALKIHFADMSKDIYSS